MKDRALLIHYPSGGFGHFMNALLSLCTDEFYVADSGIDFSNSGDSHSFLLSAVKWARTNPDYKFTPFDWAQGLNRRHIVLVDLGIVNDSHTTVRKKFKQNYIVRMCIDQPARSIVYQTCLYKAQKKEFEFEYDADWQRREEFTKQYQYCDESQDYFLNNFQPVDDQNVVNVLISWLFTDFDLVLSTLEVGLDVEIRRDQARELHRQFLLVNGRYATGLFWANRILASLDDGSNLDLSDCNTLHDQGYINYLLAKRYQIPEIPAYDYRDWFANTAQISTFITELKK